MKTKKIKANTRKQKMEELLAKGAFPSPRQFHKKQKRDSSGKYVKESRDAFLKSINEHRFITQDEVDARKEEMKFVFSNWTPVEPTLGKITKLEIPYKIISSNPAMERRWEFFCDNKYCPVCNTLGYWLCCSVLSAIIAYIVIAWI